MQKMYSRPKPSDTEEDILKLQEEFLRLSTDKGVAPAAKVVKKQLDKIEDAEHLEIRGTEAMELANTFESIPTDISIGRIVENTRPFQEKTLSRLYCPKHGFPKAKHRHLTSVVHPKRSIFSQHMKCTKSTIEPVLLENMQQITITENKASDTKLHRSNIPKCSYIVTGEESNNIHHENMEILKRMTEQEILEERQKLLSTLEPEVVQFLKSLPNKVNQNRTASIQEQNWVAKNVQVEDIESSSKILNHPEIGKWLNFDTVEPAKLTWMTDVNIPTSKNNEVYEARFDFQGKLLPFIEPEINEQNRSLYHHGDEPGRPGYTLQELFQLCRSSVIQQKVVALNTIANILFYHQSTVYNGVIEIPIEQIFFVVRFCLDDNTPAVLNSSMKALSNLFYNVHDEKCLDYLLGFGLGVVQPVLAIDNSEMNDDITINDQQLAETNLVKCLIRSNILKRIEYIINTVQPSTETIVYCLEILIRLSRDSDLTVKRIVMSNLLKSIVKYFVPVVFNPENVKEKYRTPVLEAIKLCRLLSIRDRNIAVKLIEEYCIMESISSYLSNNQFSARYGLKIQIESIHLWCVFLRYRLTRKYLDHLEPVLKTAIYFHIECTNISSTSNLINEHAAAYLNLAYESIQMNTYNHEPYIGMQKALLYDHAILKWFTQFNILEEHSCTELKMISSLINCIGRNMEHGEYYHNAYETEKLIFNLIKGKGFELLTSNIKISSNLLCKYDTHKTSANLKSVETNIKNEGNQTIPFVNSKSCLPFLNVVSKFIINCTHNEIKLAFLKHENVNKYLQELCNAHQYNLVSNWFTIFETQLIMNILKIGIAVGTEIDMSFLFRIAVKSLSIFHSGQKTDIERFILPKIVFYPCYYPLHIVELNEDELLKKSLRNLPDILDIYTQVLNLKSVKDDDDLFTDLKCNIIPVDWAYSPLVWLYSNHQQNFKISEEYQVYIISNCLKWIYIYERCFPQLSASIDPTDQFCRLACTFLGSDTLFLDPEIRDYLKACLCHVVNHMAHINFSKPIQGLNNFQDFYVQLLEQYQGVSYGDMLFGNFILLPLIQRQDVKYRKTVWSEYAGVLQIFNVTEEELMYPVDLFLNPVETDASVLHCYHRTLAMGIIPKHSLLYKIANYHLQASLSEDRK